MKKIEIEMNLKPSPSLGKKLLHSLFDYLLHSRSQIPFHFELFKTFVETKARVSSTAMINDTAETEQPRKDWKTEKQLKLAYETYEKICILKEVWKPVSAFILSF